MENGNHIEIPMDELPPAQDTVDNDNVFNELCNLLKKSKIEINSYDTYLTRIKNILSENAEAVFSKNVKGKNIFHFLANNRKCLIKSSHYLPGFIGMNSIRRFSCF